jgi:hypothetical protein
MEVRRVAERVAPSGRLEAPVLEQSRVLRAVLRVAMPAQAGRAQLRVSVRAGRVLAALRALAALQGTLARQQVAEAAVRLAARDPGSRPKMR